MEISPELRRDAPDLRPLPPSDPVLVERLRAEIQQGGPITFARFMDVALADPEHGYYATSDDRPTRAGDFLTAPELHPIFGAVLARALDEQWRALDRPSRFLLREYGAGTGALAESILHRLDEDRHELLDAVVYEPVELHQAKVDRIHERLAEAGFTGALSAAGLETREGTASSPPLDGAILANEFLDALPVHRVVVRNGRLVERYVGWSPERQRFEDVEDAPSTPAIADRLAAQGIELAEGQSAEIRLAIDDWVASMSATIGRGFATVIDYGATAPELYGPARRDGTLRAYTGQRAHADPYVAVGRQDLTAHVDFTAVERAATAHGWRALGLTTQAEFLVGSGFGDMFAARQSDPDVEPEAYLALRASAARLLDPRALGGFRVLVLARGVPEDTALRGLAYRVQG